MPPIRLLALSVCVLIGWSVSTADAQVIVYRPVVVARPAVSYYAPSVPVVSAYGVAAPAVYTPAAFTSTYYRGRVYSSAPVVAYYQPTPVRTQRVVAAPVAARAFASHTTYYAPNVAPVSPVVTIAPVTSQVVYYNPGVIITRPAYIPGQPIRNLFR